MKKRVMVQASEDMDKDTGEMQWTEEKEDGEDGSDEKVYIGKVSWASTRGEGSADRGTHRCRSC
jgi:hypothetical protein